MRVPLRAVIRFWVVASVLWAGGLIAIVLVSAFLFFPAMQWAMYGAWAWMEPRRVVTGLMSSIPLGLMIGAFFVFYEWARNDSASLRDRLMLGILLLPTAVLLCVIWAPRAIHRLVGWILA